MIESIRKNNKGITLLALIITIIILIIIVGTSMKYGMDAITYTTFQNTKTNMLLIEVKAKECVENANFDLGIKPNEATQEMKDKARSELKGTQVTKLDPLASRLPDIGIEEQQVLDGNVFKLTEEDLEKMSIRGVQSNDQKGWYIIVYNIEAATAKIYHTYGVKVGKQIKYALDDFRDVNVNDEQDVNEKNEVNDVNEQNVVNEVNEQNEVN